VNRLAQVENVRVIEPGVVREELLRRRSSCRAGSRYPRPTSSSRRWRPTCSSPGSWPSMTIPRATSGHEGRVLRSGVRHEEPPRGVVVAQLQRGDDGVFFFDVGEVKLAAEMASRMAWAVIEQMIAGKG